MSHEFSPRVLSIQYEPPHPLPRRVSLIIIALLTLLVVWSVFGRLDIVARAEGRLIPQNRLQIVQPFEGGRIAEIRVREGELVKKDQVLMTMDASISAADTRILTVELEAARIELLRVDAELKGTRFTSIVNAEPALLTQAQARYRENVTAFGAALREQMAALEQTRTDRAAAQELRDKLQQTLPIYRESERSVEKLVEKGYAHRSALLDKQRERIEVEQELAAKVYGIQSLDARIAEAEAKMESLRAGYRRQLLTEQSDLRAKAQKLEQELAKQNYRNELMELRAPQDGYIQELTTHTRGAVVPAGSTIMTLVPVDDSLKAEVYVDHKDVGFLAAGQSAKVKLAAFEFQRYGMIDARLETISQDAITSNQEVLAQSGYRGYLSLDRQYLERDGEKFMLRPGMQVSAEIMIGTRSVLEYLLSPIQQAVSEAATER